jgi:hypothetical protein
MSQLRTSQDLLTAMAYDRNSFKDKVEEKVGGALLEYYKAELGRLNHQFRWVEHWEGEVTRLLDTELVVVLLHSIKGFKDRKKAAHEVLQHLQSIDSQYRRAAERIVRRDYGLNRLAASINDQHTQTFFDRVEGLVGSHA